jgi:hypothetical protein
MEAEAAEGGGINRSIRSRPEGMPTITNKKFVLVVSFVANFLLSKRQDQVSDTVFLFSPLPLRAVVCYTPLRLKNAVYGWFYF